MTGTLTDTKNNLLNTLVKQIIGNDSFMEIQFFSRMCLLTCGDADQQVGQGCVVCVNVAQRFWPNHNTREGNMLLVKTLLNYCHYKKRENNLQDMAYTNF